MSEQRDWIGICHLAIMSEKFFSGGEAAEKEVQREFGALLQKYEATVKFVVEYWCLGSTSRGFDGFILWEAASLGDWESFTQEFKRRLGDYFEKSEYYVGIRSDVGKELREKYGW